MNKIEQLKTTEDVLGVIARLPHYAAQGWESIPEEDIHRLKWYGVFLRNPTPGKFMLRVRIPGGELRPVHIQTLATIAETYGNSIVDVTTRQQIQLRHLDIASIPHIFDVLRAVGLTSLQTGMDTVRNILTCPIAGLNPTEHLDPTSLVHTLTQTVLHNPQYTNLPRKMNVAITGCLQNCLHLETQDLAFVPAQYNLDHGDALNGYNVLVGGKLGSGGYRIASPLNIFVTTDEVVSLFEAVIAVYRDHGFRDNRNQSRLSFLIDSWGEDRFRQAVERTANRTFRREGRDLRTKQQTDHIGVFRQRQSGLNYAGIKLVVGRTTSKELRQIADLATRYGTGELRLTPHQSVIIPNIPDAKIGDFDVECGKGTLTYNPSSIYRGLVSCVGSDYCNLAVIETKRTAVEIAKQLDQRLPVTMKPITMHWSGCPAGCGNHLVADVGLLGKKIKHNGVVVDAVDVFVGGKSGPDPKLALKVLEDVPCHQLSDVLSQILPYHTRDKMHRTRSASISKSALTPASTPQRQ